MQASHGKFVVNDVVLQASDSFRRRGIQIFCLEAENLDASEIWKLLVSMYPCRPRPA